MTTQAENPGRPAANPSPAPAANPLIRRRAFSWRAALESVQVPVLAFLTALAAGGLIIVLTDLVVLAEFRDTLARLAPGGWQRLILALVLALAGAALYLWFGRVWARVRGAPPTARQLDLGRLAVLLLGVLVVYFLARAAGFAGALDAGWRAVGTAYGAMLDGSVGSLSQIVAALQSGDPAALRSAFYPMLESLVAATPYIFAGLAVAVGFRCGLFNIGVEGQLFVGAIFSVWVGYTFKGLPLIIHLPLALLAGALGGALWALPAAILKAKVGAHEVINTIMLNYIAFRLSDWLLNGPMMRPGNANPISPSIEPSAELPRFFADPIRLHLGFFIALGMAVFVWWFLFRTTLGFELRTVGANPNAARYSGMSITRNYLVAFALSGALAGLAGANEVLGVNHNLAMAFSAGYGFDSIALALLGKSHPFGVVLAALLFGTLRSGGTRMQNIAKIPVDIIGVIQALVIAFIAAPAIIRAIYRIGSAREGVETIFTRGWGKS
ncbi:MAG: ABC transporter permease [Anaerolineales bacterium]|nr:ABC transporter permease [Anaerolineales bacterium]